MSDVQERQLEARLEARARRAAKSVGLVAVKSRGGYHSDNQGGFQLVDPYFNEVVEGLRFDLSPEEVIERCRDGIKGPRGRVYNRANYALDKA